MNKIPLTFHRGVWLTALLGFHCFALESNAATQTNGPGSLTNLLAIAADAKVRKDLRVEAVQSLGGASFAEAGEALLALLGHQQPQSIQLAAITALGRFKDRRVGPELTKRWETLTPRLRSEALPVLLGRADRATALLQAIKAGTIRSSVLAGAEVEFLRHHREPGVRELAAEVLAAKPASARQPVIEAFMPALRLAGSSSHGSAIYEERCSACHRLGRQGQALGPDLITVRTNGPEKMLINILDPNREVRPEFASYLVEAKDDESLIGLVVNETAATVTVRQAYGKETILNRSDIRKLQSQGQSLMPEGLEAGLTPQDMADLIGYIEKADAGGK